MGFTASVPRSETEVDALMSALKAADVKVSDMNESNLFLDTIMSLIPFVIFGAMAFFLITKMNGGGNNKAFELDVYKRQEQWGLILLIVLTFVAEIFIEATAMINPKWHPLLGLCRRLTGYPKKKVLLEETDPSDASEILTEAESEIEETESMDAEEPDEDSQN